MVGLRPPVHLRVARVTLTAQAGCALAVALYGVFIGLLVMATGARWFWWGLLIVWGARGMAGLAAGLWALGARLGGSRAVRVVAVVIELVLLVPGLILLGLSSDAAAHAGTPQNPGTDGPFADGITGLMGMLGLLWFVGAVVVAAALVTGWWVGRDERNARRSTHVQGGVAG